MNRLLQIWKRIDPGFVVVAIICLIAIWPFISRPSLPQSTDAELHIFRLAELSYLVRHGELYPRWAPNFYHGYGYPIFNYYAPLTYYLGLVVELMPRLDAVAGVKAVFVLGILLAGGGMYGFVRDNWGRRAGYVAAAVFVYAPYIQYIDPHARGVLAESFSFGAFAVNLWALDRLRRGGGRWVWATAVLTTAAVILSHNLMGLLFFGLMFAWGMWQVIFAADRRLSYRVLAALVLGLGTAAFFWLPVYLEREAVNLTTLLGEGDNYDFRTHFLTLRDLLAPSQRLDWGATQPAFRFNLGVAQWLLGGLGVLLLLAQRVRHKGQLLFFTLALTALVFLMLPVSSFVWELVPALPFFQFPWRLLGATVAMLAILAGAGSEAAFRSWTARQQEWGTAVLVALPMLLGLPLSQPAPWPEFGSVSLARMSDIENTGRWLGTTSTADYVPATVEVIPQRKGSVVVPLYEGRQPDRVNRKTLPEGATVTAESIEPLYARYQVSAPKSFPLRLFLFDFPGWQVRVDGQRVETELGRPEGFIVVPLPAGEHLVEVEFGMTSGRAMAWAITGLSLLAMVAVGWRWSSKRGASQPGQQKQPGWVVPGVVGGITAVFILLLNPSGWLHYHSTGFDVAPAAVNTKVDFGGQIALAGYGVEPQTTAPGGTVEVTLYWRAQRPLDINFQVFVHLFPPGGPLVAQSDKINPGDFPTRHWPLDKYVRDVHTIQLPPDLPPGEYQVATGLWVMTEGWRLPVLDESGTQVGDNYKLTTFVVR